MLTLNKLGAFRVGRYFAVPYQHHKLKCIFHVKTGYIEKENGDGLDVVVIAPDAEIASERAIRYYKSFLNKKKKLRKENASRKNGKERT